MKQTIAVIFGNDRARERWFATAVPGKTASVTRHPPMIGTNGVDIRGIVICNHMGAEILRGLSLCAIVEDISFDWERIGLHYWPELKRSLLR
jgi:hypothetical protein